MSQIALISDWLNDSFVRIAVRSGFRRPFGHLACADFDEDFFFGTFSHLLWLYH